MSAPEAKHETRCMLDDIDRWENEGGRPAPQATTIGAGRPAGSAVARRASGVVADASAVVHHADRPALVIRQPVGAA